MFEYKPSRYTLIINHLILGIIEGLISNIDAKIKKARMKVETSYMDIDQPKEFLDKIEAIDNEIKKMLTEIEKLGEEGKIEESEALMTHVEMLKSKKEEFKLAGDPNAQSGLKQMKVNNFCIKFIILIGL